MVLFLGYDPGGANRHGVAKADIAPDGAFLVEPETRVLNHAGEVSDWIRENSSAKAFGVDTLLAWSWLGHRACDSALRAHYHLMSQTVIPQNSLYSAMTINGILAALSAHRAGMQLVETHPKLLLRAALNKDPEGAELARRHGVMLEGASKKKIKQKREADDMADALIAAWSASRWFFKRWENDLYTSFSDDMTFPAGPAVYPWPENVGPRC